MLPTPESEQRERRRALIRTAFFLFPLLIISPLFLTLHPLALPAFLLPVLGSAWYCYRRGLERVQRRRCVLSAPFPADWALILQERVGYYAALPPDKQERFRQMMRIFVEEKRIDGAGVEITPLMQVLVAAGAVIPVLEFPDWEYERLEVVVIRPEPFEAHFSAAPEEPLYASGLVGDHNIFSGALVLSRPDLLRDFRRHHDRTNVAIHEFAHLVDLASGRIDGIPATLPSSLIHEWEQLVRATIENRDAPENQDIPDYAFTNESEFFAVCSEYFFCRPGELIRLHPPLYRLLQAAYRQNPAALLPD